ncbi:hypothetical protein RF11_08107 [Thelohanellus kitauei]|uniref:ISXO2-like transposase domain-containing protein n=1 Tax=Thelohanellus kitauei TaxID=669202 RepID=A0A0C2MZ26_THEKT|nr:hypothetical protein RF11_08107 [Thelohanellus kitauei]
MTDCFRSYHNLNEFYTHLIINHSNTFKDPETGAHTNSNSLEGTWNALKYPIPPENRTNSLDNDGNVVENVLNDHLGEFKWCQKHSSDLWGGFLSALRELNKKFVEFETIKGAYV